MSDCDKLSKLINSKTKCVIPVHLYGQPAEMNAINKIAKDNGIFVIDELDKNINSILETSTVNDTKVIMAQKYIPDITEGDKRIIIIKGEPLPFCLARIPDGKDFRANLAKGGTGITKKLTADDIKIVNVLKKYLVKTKKNNCM